MNWSPFNFNYVGTCFKSKQKKYGATILQIV